MDALLHLKDFKTECLYLLSSLCQVNACTGELERIDGDEVTWPAFKGDNYCASEHSKDAMILQGQRFLYHYNTLIKHLSVIMVVQ